MVVANASPLARAGFRRGRGGARQTLAAGSVLTQARPGAHSPRSCRRGACGNQSPVEGLEAASPRP